MLWNTERPKLAPRQRVPAGAGRQRGGRRGLGDAFAAVDRAWRALRGDSLESTFAAHGDTPHIILSCVKFPITAIIRGDGA